MALRPSGLVLLASLALSMPAAVQAADPAPAGGTAAERCAANPDQCAALKDKFQTWCQQNPQRCDQAKERAAAFREMCAKDPQACEQKKEQWRERRQNRQQGGKS